MKEYVQDKVQVYYTSVGADFAADGLGYITPEDIASAARYVQASDRALHLVSAYLKRKYVGRWTVDERGKPQSERVYFNVSHTDGLVCLALADQAVGVDAEVVRPVEDDLARYALSEPEYATWLAGTPFATLWTAKESLVKAHGTGLCCHPGKIDALPVEGAKIYLGEVYYSRSVQLNGYVLCVTRRGAAPFSIELVCDVL